MKMYPNTIWPEEDCLQPKGEFLIEIPAVKNQEELREYCSPFLGTIFGELPFTGLRYQCEQEFAQAISGKKFVAEIYEVKGAFSESPFLFQTIAKYRKRTLLDTLGGMVFLIQYPEVFFNTVSRRLYCLRNDGQNIDCLAISKERYRGKYNGKRLVYPENISGDIHEKDHIIYYREVH